VFQEDESPDACLQQGDVCAAFPVPLLSDTTKIVNIRNQGFLEGSVPTVDHLATNSHLAVLVAVVRSAVMVLSQSCDIEDVERQESGRVMIAPVLPDDDERFAALYETANMGTGDAFGKKLAKMAKNPANAEAEFKKTQEKLDSNRKKSLEALWLGQVEGAFPLACRDPLKSRSICYFDNALSLPHTWLPLLKQTRRLRLTSEWASVLQEKLAQWLGRFAFPGTKSERLGVGGIE